MVLVGLLVLSSSCALVARAEDEDYEEGGSGDGYVSPQKDSGDFAGDLADAIEQQEFREEADKEVVSHIVEVAPPWLEVYDLVAETNYPAVQDRYVFLICTRYHRVG